MAATPKIRLFSPEKLAGNGELWLSGEQANYLSRVLRLKPEDSVIVFDGNGGHFQAVIKAFGKQKVLLKIGDRYAEEIESPLSVQLIQGISRSSRMDMVIQKSTELGVRRVTPVVTDYSVVKLDADKARRRHEHWLKISRSACEQCGRNTLPEIDAPRAFCNWLDNLAEDDADRIMLDPKGGVSLSELRAPGNALSLLVGPEGGLSDAEYSSCLAAGFRGVSLGPRTLRTETAALAGLAVVQALWGDLL